MPTPTPAEFGLPESVVSAPDQQAEPEPQILDSTEESAGEAELTYEGWLEQLEKHENLKAEHTTRSGEREKELAKAQYRRFQSAVQPAIDRWSQNSNQTKQVMTGIGQALQKAVADGTLEPNDVASILQNNQSALDALNQQMWWEGNYYILSSIGKAVDDESFAHEFLGRLDGMAKGKPDPEFVNDILARVTDPVVKAKIASAEEKGYKRGLSEAKAASKEEDRAMTRTGTGPDKAKKSATGSLPITVENASIEQLLRAESTRLQKLKR